MIRENRPLTLSEVAALQFALTVGRNSAELPSGYARSLDALQDILDDAEPATMTIYFDHKD